MNLPNPYLKGSNPFEIIEDFMRNWGLDPNSSSDKSQLATSLNLSYETVNHWFIKGKSRRTPTSLVIDHLKTLHAFYYQKLLLDNIYPIHWISSYESLKEKRLSKFSNELENSKETQHFFN